MRRRFILTGLVTLTALTVLSTPTPGTGPPVAATTTIRAAKTIEPAATIGSTTTGTLLRLDRRVITAPKGRATPCAVTMPGPYVLAGSPDGPDDTAVFRGDGTLAADLSNERPVAADIFGSTVAYTTTAGRIRSWDVARPRSATNPRTVGSAGTRPSGPVRVAIWGSTLAWTRKDGKIVVRTSAEPSAGSVSAVTLRVIDPKTPIEWLRLSDRTLSWAPATQRAWLLNLASPTSRPVAVPGLTCVVVDDHQLAGVDEAGVTTIRALPFGLTTAHRPRLLGVLAPAVFDPAKGPWSPQVDVTKPVRKVRLNLTLNGTIVRVLSGTGPGGSVRDLTWDGLDRTGLPAANGRYRWTLTAEASDDEGTLTNGDGTTPVTGGVTLKRTS